MLSIDRHEIWMGLCALALTAALSHSTVKAQEATQEASAVPVTEARGAPTGETGSIASNASGTVATAEPLKEVEVKPAAKPEATHPAGKPWAPPPGGKAVFHRISRAQRLQLRPHLPRAWTRRPEDHQEGRGRVAP